jgi:hypothetical protein
MNDFFRETIPCLAGRTFTCPLRGLITTLRAEKCFSDFIHGLKVSLKEGSGMVNERNNR